MGTVSSLLARFAFFSRGEPYSHKNASTLRTTRRLKLSTNTKQCARAENIVASLCAPAWMKKKSRHSFTGKFHKHKHSFCAMNVILARTQRQHALPQSDKNMSNSAVRRQLQAPLQAHMNSVDVITFPIQDWDFSRWEEFVRLRPKRLWLFAYTHNQTAATPV